MTSFNAYGWENTAVTLDHVNLTVSEAVVFQDNSDFRPASISIINSNVSCLNTLAFCDLMYFDVAKANTPVTLSMTGNNITCTGDATAGCRGFTVDGSNLIAVSMTPSLNGNYWVTKVMPALPLLIINGAVSSTEVEFQQITTQTFVTIPGGITSAAELIVGTGP